MADKATTILADVPFTIGQVNGSGIGKKIYYIAAENVTAWPTIVDNLADATRAEEYIGYTGDFTLGRGAFWITIYNTQGEGSLDAEPLGERDSLMFKNKLMFRFPKLTPEVLVLINSIVNGDGYFVAWHDGHYRVIGHKHYRTEVSINVTSGNTAGSSKGATITVECPDYKALPIYRGKLVLANSTTLDCSLDEKRDFENGDRGFIEEDEGEGDGELPNNDRPAEDEGGTEGGGA